MGNRKIHSIEGLRALAVISVVAFHLWPRLFPGGFLGVDFFFIISGFVITSLLAEQVRAQGELDFKSFYKGRFRRLAPAIAVVIGVSLIGASIFNKDLKTRGLSDLAFIFTGTYNWHLSVGEISYFDQWSPPLFQHLWSLAVETQFYTLWPLIFFAMTWRWTSRQIARNLAFASILIAAWLIASDLSSTASLSGTYFTTHLHMLSLLVGAALAFVWRPELLHEIVLPQAKRVLNWTAGASALGLALMLLLVTEKSGQSIYVIVAILGGLLLALAVHPASLAGRLLSLRFLVEVGRRSYSIYLWHWPVQLLTPTGTFHAPLVIAITAGLSELTYRFIEEPFRTRSFRLKLPRFGIRFAPALPATFLVVGVVFAAILTPSVSPAAQGLITTASVADGGGEDPTTPVQASDTPATTPAEPVAADIKSSVFIGDSVLLGIRTQVPADFNVKIFDGLVGRQAPDVLATLKRVSPDLRDGLVVINVGNNGTISDTTTKWIFEQLKSFKVAVVLNTHVPRAWQEPNNSTISRFVERYPTVRLADWASASQGHPEYFGPDGVHLTLAGQRAYVATIRAALD